MIKNTHLVFTFWVIALFIACKDDSNSKPQSTACQSPVQLTSFPLNIGNEWKYHRSITVHDSNGAVTFNILYDHYWEVVSDTLINGLNTYKISHRDSCSDGSVYFGASYCQNTQDGFYLIAQEALYASGIGLKLSTGIASMHSFSPFNILSLRTDTIFVPDSVICCLKFPSQLGQIWTSSTNPIPAGSIEKRKYEDCQSVTTPAGMYDCMKIHVYRENGSAIDSASTIYYHYSTKGIISQSYRLPTTGNTGQLDGGWVDIDVNLVNINF